MANRGILFFKFLRLTILKKAFETTSKEELCKFGARDLSKYITKNENIVISQHVSTKWSTFTVGDNVHKIGANDQRQGIEYLIDGESHGVIENSDIEEVPRLRKHKRIRMFADLLGQLNTEVKKTEKAESRAVTDMADLKLDGISKEIEVGRNEKEETNLVFHRFIDQIKEKIPANKSGLTYNLLKSLAVEVTLDQPHNFETRENDGSTVFTFMDDNGALHEFVLNNNGFVHRIDGEQGGSFKGYDEILAEYRTRNN